MNIKYAYEQYFLKLKKVYLDTLGTEPTISWDSKLNQKLILSQPDSNGEAQWEPIPASKININGLCNEMIDFYSSYYYFSFSGKYKDVIYNFDSIDSYEKAVLQAKQALADGEYYFKQQNTLLIASCSLNGNDDLLLFYRQNDSTLFLYDVDKRFIHPTLSFSLVELIGSMEALI